MSINEQIKKVIRRDVVGDMEKLTGSSIHDNPLAFLAESMIHNCVKDNLLYSLDDTVYSDNVQHYKQVIESLGFGALLRLPFVGNSVYKNIKEYFYIYWHKQYGILLAFDTFGTDKVNSAQFWFNWKPFLVLQDYYDALYHASGGWRQENIFAGYIDAREAVRYNLNNLCANGTFVTPWVEQPFMWLLHYMDTKDSDYDYDKINAERIGMLPVTVQRAIEGI
jgi:hypothetical protein